jgi:hypothetical protein
MTKPRVAPIGARDGWSPWCEAPDGLRPMPANGDCVQNRGFVKAPTWCKALESSRFGDDGGLGATRSASSLVAGQNLTKTTGHPTSSF